MVPLPADAADLIAKGFGDRRLAGALGITRHRARQLIHQEAHDAAAEQYVRDLDAPPQKPSTAKELFRRNNSSARTNHTLGRRFNCSVSRNS